MAFVCTIDDLGTDYAEFYRSEDRRSHALTIPVGYDPTRDVSYTLLVTLGPDAAGCDEFAFCILEYDIELDAIYTIWSALEVAHKIPSPDRAKILSVLLNAAAFFASTQRPRKIVMCTYEPIPDGKPVRKYLLIAKAFEKFGYRIWMPDVYLGQRIWWMERDETPTIDNVTDEPFKRPSDGDAK